MKNPYEVLSVSQNANVAEITKAKMKAMMARKYTNQEIAYAYSQLLKPSKRLAADFLFPSKIKAKRPKLLQVIIDTEENVNIDENAFNSLKIN
jgi:hypothetical protein